MTKKTTYTLIVPERFSDNFGDPINKLLTILPDLNKHWEEIVIDFGQNKFMVPHYLGPLSCILKMKKNQGVKILIINENSYLEAVQFKNGFLDLSSSIQYQQNAFIYFQDKTYIPIIHFPTSLLKNESEYRDSILSAVNSILKQQLKLPLNVLEAIYYLLDELTQNIVDHSAISFGTVFAQFYNEKKSLDLSICDAGKGLYQSYVDNIKHKPTSNEEAINFGVYGKSTKNIPESRGFGLNTSRNMLTKGLNGNFFMMTGNGFFIQNNEREEIVTTKGELTFNGCMLNLRIPLFEMIDFTIHSYTDL